MKKRLLLLSILCITVSQGFAQTPLPVSNYYKYYHQILSVPDGMRAFDQEYLTYAGNATMGSKHQYDNQQWVIMPITVTAKNGEIQYSNEYVIASKYNGRVLDLNDKLNIRCNTTFIGTNWQLFKLNSISTNVYEISTPYNPHYTISESNSSQKKDPFSNPGFRTHNLYLSTRYGTDNQKFRPTTGTSFANPITSLRNQRTTQMSAPPNLPGLHEDLDIQTPKVFASETLIPFLFVNENSPSLQVITTPYYRLVKSNYWLAPERGDGDKIFHAGMNRQITRQIKVGITQSSATEVAQTINTSFTESGEVGGSNDSDLAVRMSHSLQQSMNLSAKINNTITDTYEKTYSETLSYTLAQDTRIVGYTLVDHYDLYRANGTLYKSWRVLTENVVEKTYPTSGIIINGQPGNNFRHKTTNKSTYTVRSSSTSARTDNSPLKKNSSDKSTLEGIKGSLDNASEFNIFPNPSEGIFTIRQSQDQISDYTVEIYSTLGVKVFEKKDIDSSIKDIDVNISHTPAGLYIVRVSSKEQVIEKQILKK